MYYLQEPMNYYINYYIIAASLNYNIYCLLNHIGVDQWLHLVVYTGCNIILHTLLQTQNSKKLPVTDIKHRTRKDSDEQELLSSIYTDIITIQDPFQDETWSPC